MKSYWRIVALLLLALLMSLAACTGASAPAPTAEAPSASVATDAEAPETAPAADSAAPLKVVATYSVLGDFIQRIAGDAVELTVLVGPDGDPHVFEPTPRDAVALAEADLVFENGLEFETWLDDLFTASGSTATRIAASDGVNVLAFADHGDEHDDDHDDEHEAEDDHEHEEGDAHEEGHEGTHEEGHEEAHAHEHGEFDPHIWLSPLNAIVMVENIRAALAAADPANADLFNANAAAYTEELQQLDAELRAQIETIPAERRKLVTTHDLFGYFARDYGFEVLGSALGAVTTEAADPSAGQIAELVEEIRSAGVRQPSSWRTWAIRR
jgi:zinc/manganese transport system substrate-binding protein